jgi:hypothetical protein
MSAIFDDNVVFFRIDSIHSPASAAAAVFYFRSPISWPKRNVKTIPPPGLSSTLIPP